MKVNWCNRAMFTGPHYCLVTSEKLLRQEVKKLGIKFHSLNESSEHADATCYELVSDQGKTAFIVYMKKWKGEDPIEVASLIVHEATHIKQHVIRLMGEHNTSNEFEAYMMQNIAGNLMQCFAEQTK